MKENKKERKRAKVSLRKFLIATSFIVILVLSQVPSAQAFGGQDMRNFLGSVMNVVFQGKTPYESTNTLVVNASKPQTRAVEGISIDPDAFAALQQKVGNLSLQISSLNQAPSQNALVVDTAGVNLLRNSSFEAGGTGSIPSQWNTQLDSNSGNTFISQEGIHSGSYGLKFVGGGTGNFGISQPNTKTTPQRTYTLSAWVKNVNASNATFRIGFWDEQNNKEGSFKNITISGTKDWYRISTTVTTGGLITDSKNYYPMFQVQGLTSGAVYLDDVMLTEGSVLTTYNSAQANAGTNSSALGDGAVLGSTGGDLYPAQSGVGQLGTSSNRWSALNLTKATIDNNGNLNLSGGLTIGALGSGILHSNGSGSITSSATNLASSDVTGTLPVGNGGTGVTTTPTNGQVLIGNGSGYSLGTLTAGSGVTITNAAGGITIAASSGSGASFSTLSGGTNTGAAMIVGTGASLTTSGSGTINATTVNGLTVASGKTLTANNSLTLSGTDGTTMTFPTANDTVVGTGATQTLTNKTLTAPTINGTVATTGLTLPAFTASGNITGSGSPTISSFGAINGLTLTANATGFGIAGGTTAKTLTVSNTLTLAGTDGTTMTFPTATDTVVGIGATQTLTNKTLTAPAINGTVTTTGLTLPAFTAGGNITGSGALSVTSGGATALTLDAGGAAGINIGTTNANGVTIGRSGVTTTVSGPLATSSTVNGLTLTSAADGFTVAGGTTSRTLTVTGANITVGSTIQPTSAGVLAVQSNGANALTLDAGGAAAVNVGNTNANALNFGNGTNNPNYTFNGTGTFSTSTGANNLNGNTTIAANRTLTLTSGTGTITQNYSNTTGTATTFNVTNSNAAAGTSVNGLSVAMVGTAPSSGTNTNTGINFANVSAVANNTFNALTFGTGYTNFVTSPNINVTSGGVITGAGSYNGVTLSSTAVQPAVAGAFTFQSTGANAVTLDTGGAAGVNIGTTNANAITLGANTTVSANKTLTLASGTGTVTQNYSNTTGTATTFNVTNSNAAAGTSVNGLSVAMVGTAPSSGTNTNTGINFANVSAVANNNFNALTFGTGYTNFLTSPNITITSAGNITGAGTIGSGAITVTSTSANALTVGAGGSLNPVLQVNASTASVATGLSVTGAATGGTTALAAIDSGANTNLTLDGKGTGTVGINTISATSGLVTIGNSTSNAGATVNGPLTATGFIKSTGSTGIGYGAGAGGTVTQLTSRSTGVTLNKTTGQITLFSAAGSATATSFTVTNSTVAATDTILLNQNSGTNLYELFVTNIAAGSFQITFLTTGGTAVDAPVINYTVVKGSSN